MLKIIFTLVCLTFAFILSAGKPLALVNGGAYAKYDIDHLVCKVIYPAHAAYDLLENMPASAEYKNYAAIFVFSGGKTLTPEEIHVLREYIESGGVLVITGNAPRELSNGKFEAANFPGLKTVGMQRDKNAVMKVLEPNHPLFVGVALDPLPRWLSRSILTATPGTATRILAGNGKNAILTETTLGKGRIYWFWEAYLRISKQDENNLYSLEKVFSNLLKSIDTEKVGEELQRKYPGKGLLVWQREWQRWPQERPHFEPNGPRKGEEVAKLEFFSATGERDTRFFVVQSPTRTKLVITAPATPFTLLKMSKAAPMYERIRKDQPREWADAEGNYFLRPAPTEIELEPGLPEVFALRLDTSSLKAGTYSAKIGLNAVEIPVTAKVYPVSLEGRRPVSLRTWGADLPLTPEGIAMMKLHNVVQTGFPLIRTNEIKLKSNGMTLDQAVAGHPELFRDGKFPELEFPDSYRKAAHLKAINGLYAGRLPGLSIHSLTARAAGLSKAPPIAEWNETMKNFYAGFYREWMDFYRSRGVTDVFHLGFDEPSKEVIERSFLPQAKLLHEAGIKTGSSWTSHTTENLELLDKIAPYAYWSCYTVIAHKIEDLKNSGALKHLPDDAAFGYMIGSTPETRRPSEYARTYAHYFFSLGPEFRFAHVGPFWKEWLFYGYNPVFGVWGQRLFAYGDAEHKTLLNCAYIEGVRDGVDDANLFWYFNWYCSRLRAMEKKHPEIVPALRRADAARKRWLDELAFHPVKRASSDKPYEYMSLGRNLSPERAEYFKKEILDELMELQPLTSKYIPSEVRCSGLDLSRGAKITGGKSLNGIRHNPEAAVKIRLETSPRQHPGDYSIAYDRAAGRITICGGDQKGLELGIRAMENSLEHFGDWMSSPSPRENER